MLHAVHSYLLVGITVVVTAFVLSFFNNIRFHSPKLWAYILVNTVLLGTVFMLFEDKRPYLTLFSFVVYTVTAMLILKMKAYKAVLTVGLLYILTAIGDLFSYELLVGSLGMSVKTVQNSFLLALSVVAIDSFVVITFVLLLDFGKKFKEIIFSYEVDRKTKLYLFFYIIGVLGFVTGNFVLLNSESFYTQNLAWLDVVFSLFFLLNCLLYIFAQQKSLLQYKENEQLKISLETIQELSQELRRFKHNYLNILHSIGGYIENREWNELEKYYNEIVAENQKISNNNVFAIQKIKNYALLGLLSSKIKTAKAKGINFKLDVFGEVDGLKIKTPELCEVLGIYLDNAIEAAEQAEEKEVAVVFLEEKDTVTIIIDNTYAEKPDMNKIFKGYSTKGKDRGLGLIIARDILSRYDDVLSNTYLKDNKWFRQEMVIPKK